MARRVKFVPHYSKSDESWFVSIPPSLSKTGKRARLFFKNRAEALRASRRLKERHAKFGVSLSNLDPVRLGEASEAYKLLDAQNRPYSLLSIVREVQYSGQHSKHALNRRQTFSGNTSNQRATYPRSTKTRFEPLPRSLEIRQSPMSNHPILNSFFLPFPMVHAIDTFES